MALSLYRLSIWVKLLRPRRWQTTIVHNLWLIIQTSTADVMKKLNTTKTWDRMLLAFIWVMITTRPFWWIFTSYSFHIIITISASLQIVAVMRLIISIYTLYVAYGQFRCCWGVWQVTNQIPNISHMCVVSAQIKNIYSGHIRNGPVDTSQ